MTPPVSFQITETPHPPSTPLRRFSCRAMLCTAKLTDRRVGLWPFRNDSVFNNTYKLGEVGGTLAAAFPTYLSIESVGNGTCLSLWERCPVRTLGARGSTRQKPSQSRQSRDSSPRGRAKGIWRSASPTLSFCISYSALKTGVEMPHRFYTIFFPEAWSAPG